ESRSRTSRTELRSATPRAAVRALRSAARSSRHRAYARDAARCRFEPAAGGVLERAAEEEACGERVAGAGRVDDVRLDGREVEACVLGDDDAPARAAFDHAGRRREIRAAE